MPQIQAEIVENARAIPVGAFGTLADERKLAAIFTAQTVGESLNYHQHLRGLLADGHWKDRVFETFSEVDLKAIEQAFAERVLAQLHKQELISDDDVVQILSQDHTSLGFAVPP